MVMLCCYLSILSSGQPKELTLYGNALINLQHELYACYRYLDIHSPVFYLHERDLKK